MMFGRFVLFSAHLSNDIVSEPNCSTVMHWLQEALENLTASKSHHRTPSQEDSQDAKSGVGAKQAKGCLSPILLIRATCGSPRVPSDEACNLGSGTSKHKVESTGMVEKAIFCDGNICKALKNLLCLR
jgi:hypothetical protein